MHSPPFPIQAPKGPRLDTYDERCASWASDEETKIKDETDVDAGSVAPSTASSSSGGTPPPARPPPASAVALSASVDAAIASLGGRVLPKLNWSAPVDAAWLVPNNCIACENADEVRGEKRKRGASEFGPRLAFNLAKRFLLSLSSSPRPPLSLSSPQVLLLLQASDRISDDLDQLAKLGCEAEGGSAPSPPLPAVLALRAWRHLRPGREVRAFVVAGALAALCQRDVTQAVPGMAEERKMLARAVGKLFADAVGPAFAAACAGAAAPASPPATLRPPSPPLRLHYTFDAYVHASGKARLIDINPVGGATAPLLFEWGELFPGDGVGGETKAGPQTTTWPPEEETFAWGDAAAATPAPIPFRVVDTSTGAARIAPGRTLYGAPHDLVAGEAVEELARRMRRGELGPMHG